MKYDEITVGMVVWSMINNFPEKFTVDRISPEKVSVLGSKHLYPSRFPPIFILRDNAPKTLHSRWPDQLARTKDELKQMVFGESESKIILT